MSLNDIGTLVGIILGISGAILGSTIGLYKYFTNKIERSQKEQEAKVSRVYERFDEYKKDAESKFVWKDLHSVVYQQYGDNFTKLESRMEEGFKGVDNRLTELQQMVIKLIGARRNNNK